MKYCPKCGHQNLNSLAFCSQCNAVLPPAPKITCKVCGTELINGKCPQCAEEKETQSLFYMAFGAIGTLVAMLIIGFNSMETRELVGEYTWKGTQKYETYIPGNKAMIIFIIFLASFIIQSLFSGKNFDKSNRTKPNLVIFFQLILGFLILRYFINL